MQIHAPSIEHLFDSLLCFYSLCFFPKAVVCFMVYKHLSGLQSPNVWSGNGHLAAIHFTKPSEKGVFIRNGTWYFLYFNPFSCIISVEDVGRSNISADASFRVGSYYHLVSVNAD